jgi:hypothetical protein
LVRVGFEQLEVRLAGGIGRVQDQDEQVRLARGFDRGPQLVFLGSGVPIANRVEQHQTRRDALGIQLVARDFRGGGHHVGFGPLLAQQGIDET